MSDYTQVSISRADIETMEAAGHELVRLLRHDQAWPLLALCLRFREQTALLHGNGEFSLAVLADVVSLDDRRPA